eukprot:5985291-Ditylum_brightwellii.AAC.1
MQQSQKENQEFISKLFAPYQPRILSQQATSSLINYVSGSKDYYPYHTKVQPQLSPHKCSEQVEPINTPKITSSNKSSPGHSVLGHDGDPPKPHKLHKQNLPKMICAESGLIYKQLYNKK